MLLGGPGKHKGEGGYQLGSFPSPLALGQGLPHAGCTVRPSSGHSGIQPSRLRLTSLKSYLTLCNPMDCSTPGFPVHHQLPELAQTHELVMPSNHLILCHPLLPPSIFPSIRVFSNESALCIRWPKYWSFSFNISPFNEHPGLISFRMDWLDLLAVQGTLKSLLQHHSSNDFQVIIPI